MFGVVGLFPDLVLQSRLAGMDKILSTLGLPRIRPFGRVLNACMTATVFCDVYI